MPLPNDQIFDSSKLKGFAHYTLLLPRIGRFVFFRADDIVEKGEKPGKNLFLLIPTFLTGLPLLGPSYVGLFSMTSMC